MEVIYFILAIVVIFMVARLSSSISEKFHLLQQRLDALTEELKNLRKEQHIAPPVQRPLEEEQRAAQAKPAPRAVPEQPAIKEEPKPTAPTPKPAEPVREEVKPPAETISFPKPITVPPSAPAGRPPVSRPPEPPKPGFFERNPDLEKFIGENLANKIGIAILVLGIGFFVKYAIDQEWIGEIGRVAIGILCGGILLGVAHRLRNTFTAFSSVLVGGGIAVLYLTIAIAFHKYEIFSQTAAFILMVVITGFTVMLSLGYNRIELAVVALLGGFASPFMVSTGEGNYVVLFIYVLILDGGMLVLAYYKKWNLVNIICYVFTVLLFGSWLGAKFDGDNTGMIAGGIIFATLFYLVFFAMNLVNNLRQRTPFKAIEFTLLLSNTFFYYAAGMVLLDNEHGEAFKGLFTVALGVFNFAFAYALYKSSKVDKNLVFLLIGLVLTFASLAAPVQLEGNYITLFWAAEAVLLLWLSQKSGIQLMKLASVLVMSLMIISLLMDWTQIYLDGGNGDTISIIFNKGYITSLVSLASVVITLFLLKHEQPTENIGYYKGFLMVTALLILYCSQSLELRHHLIDYEVAYETQNIILGCYNILFMVGLMLAETKIVHTKIMRQAFASWGLLAIALYLLFYHGEIITARDAYLTGGSGTGFGFHYLLVALVVLATVLSLKKVRVLATEHPEIAKVYAWFFVFVFLFIASAELDHLVVMVAYSADNTVDHIINQNHKIGYPILWGLSSFLLIWLGFKTKKKSLRIISLTLFSITLVKLFLFDIRGISEGGKIAAFILLGVLLLIVSFMYQRLKKLLLADEAAAAEKPVEP